MPAYLTTSRSKRRGRRLPVILTIDASLARASAGVVQTPTVLAQRVVDGARGHPANLAPMVEEVLRSAKIAARAVDAIAVSVGPGSFTGLRAAISLAVGFALAAEKPVVPVNCAEIAAAALPHLGARELWTAIDNRRGRVFLDRGDGFTAFGLDALPTAPAKLAVAGDCAIEVAARLAAMGVDVMLSDVRQPWPLHIALAAVRKLSVTALPFDIQPLYVDPAEAMPPRGGLRPAPAA